MNYKICCDLTPKIYQVFRHWCCKHCKGFVNFAFLDWYLIGKINRSGNVYELAVGDNQILLLPMKGSQRDVASSLGSLHPAGFLQAELGHKLCRTVVSIITWCLLRTVGTHSAMTNPCERLSLEWLNQLLRLRHWYFLFFYKCFWI